VQCGITTTNRTPNGVRRNGQSGCRFCCSHSKQADLDLAKKRILPLRPMTSHFWSAWLNSIWLALVISSRPRSCNEMASVQRQWAVPSGLNDPQSGLRCRLLAG
jgi:hypothetical protein